MSSYGLIEEITLGIDEKQRQRILDKLPSNEISKLDAEEVATLLQQQNIEPLSKVIYQSDQTNSNKYNDQFKNYYLDLYTIFNRSKKIDSAIFNEKTLNSSAMTEINQKMNKTKNRIKSFSFIVNNSDGFTRAYRENFTSKKNFLNLDYKTESTYVDPRTNNIYNEENLLCTINKRNKALTLNETGVLSPFISSMIKVNQTGSNLVEDANRNYPIENLLDSQMWNEVILTNKPFDVYFKEPLYYGETKGALCKIQVVFNTMQPINNINLVPFAEFPFKVLGITAYDNLIALDYVNNYEGVTQLDVSKIDGAIEILSPENEDTMDPFYLEDPVSISFKKMDNIRAIEISLQQPHYKISKYNIEKNDKEKINLVEELFSKNKMITNINQKDYINSVTELDFSNRDLEWKPFDFIYKKFMSLIGDFDNNIVDKTTDVLDKLIPSFDKGKFKKVRSEKNNVDLEVNPDIKIKKYNYQYGLNSLDVNYTQYSDVSMYVSSLFEVDSNVKEVALNSEETIPVDEKDMNIGSIEYYVSNLSEPAAEDWFPILPGEKDRFIEDEVSYPEPEGENSKIELLFEATKTSIRVEEKKKGVTILKYLDKDEAEVTNNNIPVKYIIIQKPYSSSDFYLSSYEIHEAINPYIVDFNEVANKKRFLDKEGEIGEKFPLGTDRFDKIELSHYPYVDYSKVNKSAVDPDYIYNNYTNPNDFIKKLIYNNPNVFYFNPNYKGDNGYRPLVISMNGEVDIFDKSSGSIITKKDVLIENDEFGIPYSYSYIKENENTYEVIDINRNENSTMFFPYFYNVTDYVKRLHPNLDNYDPYDYPVFEYLQLGKEIYFNEPLNAEGQGNKGEITVDYHYLIEGIRVKIIIRKNPFSEADISPTVHSYTIKTRDFQY